MDPFDRPLDRDAAEWLRARQFDRRIVTVTGSLDETLATQVAAQLMTLDATGDDGVTLQLDCAGGALDAAFTVIDTIDLLGVPVRARCSGRVDGVGVGVLAVASHRVATPHARFRLALPDARLVGSAVEMEAAAHEHQRRVEAFVRRLAAGVGRPFEPVEADCERGRWLDADEALGYGLVDEIERRRPDEPPRERAGLGFR